MAMIKLAKSLKGKILDIGGGGEGVIGRIYQSQVTAIDNRQDELDEAPDSFTKILMDAVNLNFPDASFDHVTSFYTLMYVEKCDHPSVIQEACRVLKPGGSLQIWDAVIHEANPFVVKLDIDANGTRLHPTYGIYKEDAAQSAGYFKSICKQIGFTLITEEISDKTFFLHFKRA